ncbi:phosphate ABC transporter permease subunit PstC [Marispirochaeta sp.]|uniref:phosphate ABC transporter permease subunit PstC n=1 Tax=Marispirochaeta sp. TaxID=2038653 RepID=UPI0029C74A7E|nr:phosphate ABC transporter permease subunit PstC [Marispirochaeta sp.]
MNTRKIRDEAAKHLFAFCAFVSVLSVVFITIFIFLEGLPLFEVTGVLDFLIGTVWEPTGDPAHYGILPFIAGSIWVTFGSLMLALPVGLSVGIFMAEYATGRFANTVRSVVELLAGIPSVIYGLFGYIAIAPIVRNLTPSNTGLGVLTASIVLAIMVLPTIINITEVSLRAVTPELKEASLALGATHWQTIVHTLIPAARSGILAGIVLGMGRSIGETMAVLMVAGNAVTMPTSPLSLARTLTMNVATDMSYASGEHWTSLFTTGMVLFVFILIINISVQVLMKKAVKDMK